MKDSKQLWLKIDKQMRPEPITLGRYTTQAYVQDPIRLSFITSRYKFCARMLADCKTALEIGCGDGFGGGMVAQLVDQLICTDINKEILSENREKMANFENIKFEYHDFRETPYKQKVDAIYLIDTIEHIYPDEEVNFMTNLIDSLNDKGICLIGTPNITADEYANNWSREGHVNLKNHESLMELARQYFSNSFFFGMNDEVLHTGFPPMTHFMWALCVGPKKR